MAGSDTAAKNGVERVERRLEVEVHGGKHDSFLILRFENIEKKSRKKAQTISMKLLILLLSSLFPLPIDLVQYLQRSTPIVVSVYLSRTSPCNLVLADGVLSHG